jgi:hypothetical protein
MSSQIQYRRGTSAQTASFTGALGEITVDTTNKVIVVHDGLTIGGFSGVSTTATQTLTNKTLSGVVVTGTVTANGGVGSSGQYLESTGTGVRWSTVDATQIFSGTSSVSIISSGGNIRANVAGATVGVFSTAGANITGTLGVTGNITGGNLSGTSIVGTLTTASQTNITSVGTLGALSVTGNITFGGSLIDTAALEIITGSNGNITLSPNGSGVIVANKDIVNGQANGTGNIGSSSTYFNTIFAKATSAQYADVAERYLADAEYPVGTVLIIGGDREVTQSNTTGQTSIAGTVSENPGVLMNRGLEGEHVAAVALLGRVPCRVVGAVNKGDLLMSSGFPGVACKLENYTPGCVIGKALESYSNNTEGTIEIMVGRL